MYRNSIAIFFTVLLMAIVTAPTVLVAIDDTIDVSVVLDTSEEEEKETKTIDDIKLLFIESNLNYSFLSKFDKSTFSYHYKKYNKPHLNLISPPPEYIIL